MRVHLFPSRTQKLSSSVLTILGWKRPGKIRRCRHNTTLAILRWLNSLNALIAQSVGSHEPLPVAEEGEVRTGKNKEYHEALQASETTMFLTDTLLLFLHYSGRNFLDLLSRWQIQGAFEQEEIGRIATAPREASRPYF